MRHLVQLKTTRSLRSTSVNVTVCWAQLVSVQSPAMWCLRRLIRSAHSLHGEMLHTPSGREHACELSQDPGSNIRLGKRRGQGIFPSLSNKPFGLSRWVKNKLKCFCQSPGRWQPDFIKEKRFSGGHVHVRDSKGLSPATLQQVVKSLPYRDGRQGGPFFFWKKNDT